MDSRSDQPEAVTLIMKGLLGNLEDEGPVRIVSTHER